MGIRSIEFRGKRVDNGEWIYGVPFFQENQCYMIEDLFICDEYQCTGATNTEVIPETVGQYTGLCDKNGTKIFEGDIVKIEKELCTTICSGTTEGGTIAMHREYVSTFEGQGIIVFENGAYIMKDEDYGDYFLVCCDDNTIIEVIGNIHDNPELLKGVKE